ncbi:hypothetical protein [Tropicimonas sp. S265A]|uniref:hypothetical protein n=1 Tax=Tropicimonas sp. S265A TaxID=3415134 RepID=UPI003C7C24AC
MSYPTLPAAIPALALRENWSSQPIDPLVRTDLDDGGTALERKFSRVPVLYSLAWRLDGGQYDLFMDFWLRDLDAGRHWFLCPIVEGLRERMQVVRIFGEPPRAGSPANGIFEVSFQAELRELEGLNFAERIALDAWIVSDRDVTDLIADLTPVVAALEAMPRWP